MRVLGWLDCFRFGIGTYIEQNCYPYYLEYIFHGALEEYSPLLFSFNHLFAP